MKALAALLLALFLSFGVHAQTGNLSGVIAPSAARTATFTSADIANVSNRGVHVIIDVTAYTSGTWTPTIEGRDPVSGKYYVLITGPAIGSVSTTVLKLYPGVTVAANVAVSDVLPKTWRVVVTGASTPIATFSVGYNSVQ